MTMAEHERFTQYKIINIISPVLGITLFKRTALRNAIIFSVTG
jgi:hypothetical protein